MLTWRLVVLGALFGCACHPQTMSSSSPPPASRQVAPVSGDAWHALASDFLEGYLTRAPVDATSAGDHRGDGRWPDLSLAGRAELRAFLVAVRDRLTAIPRDALDQEQRADAQTLADSLAYQLLVLDELRPSEREPRFYTDLIGEGLDPLVNRSFGTPASRLASLIERLDGIAPLVASAKQWLTHPARLNTETAISQNQGLIRLVEHELPVRFPEGGQALTDSRRRAATALRELQAFFEQDLLPRSDGEFRLGRELFTKKLRLVLQDDVDIDALAASARALLEQTQREMVATARDIWHDEKLGQLPPLETPAQQQAFVRRVLSHVADDHPTNQSIVGDAQQWLAQATAFVREHDLVRVPDDPVQVIEMPEYRRGVAIAYCDSSGPLERTPETFYAISPIPADWSAERSASFYREYNQAMLADLTVHEAMPGHYLQLMHNNAQRSKLRAVFSSGAFVEGWAVYSEWLMAELGFGGPRVKLQRQKMVLRLAANALLDHGVHAGQMEEPEAMALMIGEAFQEEGEAVGKWRRARLTGAQLTTYFYGFTQILDLRKAASTKPGFVQRSFHDRLLSFGSPAPRLLRELMGAAH